MSKSRDSRARAEPPGAKPAVAIALAAFLAMVLVAYFSDRRPSPDQVESTSDRPRQYDVLVKTHTRDVVPKTNLGPALLTLKHAHGVLLNGSEDTGRLKLVIETSFEMPEPGQVPTVIEFAEREVAERAPQGYLMDFSYHDEEITPEDLQTIGVSLVEKHTGKGEDADSGVLVVKPDSGAIDGSLARRIERCPRVRYAAVHVGPARYEHR
jgi:hypothetical protein